ncbi:MAG: hypothetical protein R3300_13980 [Candidatus Promineifilaceae bacterium]|nr:hypothetical protein [Candidatus Promineifilaceae bacterium]
MTRYLISHRVQLLGLSLLGLLALIFVLLAQTGPLTGPEIGRRVTENQPVADTVDADPLADVHPADRKFFTNDYENRRSAMTAANFLASVHPADRKFFTGNYVTSSAAVTRAQVEAEAADRKLQDPAYLEALMAQVRVDPLANVHPADRKFFTNGYIWTTPADEAGADSD